MSWSAMQDARICLVLLSPKQDSFFELADAGRALGKDLARELKVRTARSSDTSVKVMPVSRPHA